MDRPLLFLFPGIGDHGALVGSSLLNVPLYKETIVEGFDYLKNHHDIDLFWTLTPNTTAPDTKGLDKKPANSFASRLKQARAKNSTQAQPQEPINQTLNAHPFLFLHQMALTKLLESEGLIAHSCVGYSLGEYTAATCCGAMQLSQALDLIATRAKLVDALPQANMLAVAANSEDIKSILPPEVSIAAVNSPLQTIVAGPCDAINRLQSSLAGQHIICHSVRADHGFHTPLLETVSRDLAPWIGTHLKCHKNSASFRLKKHWLSSINQMAIANGEQFNHDYWLTQLTQPVQFSNTVKNLVADNFVLIEVGPGRALSLLIKQNPAFPQTLWPHLHAVLPSLNEGEDHETYFRLQVSQLIESNPSTLRRNEHV